MKNRIKAYLIIGLVYILALSVGLIFFNLIIKEEFNIWNTILAFLVCDIIATLVIWVFTIIFKNSSFYDPYWSLVPWFFVLYMMIYFNFWSSLNIVFLIAFGFWSFRLTFNWAYTCKNLKTEDWRYEKFRKENKFFLWHIINFFGIQMMPTLIVFVGLIPALILVSYNSSFQLTALLGLVIIVFGTVIELFADLQMHSFLKEKAGKKEVLQNGLWQYSRHPNYFGEITIWIGVYLTMLSISNEYWYFGIGSILMILLFNFISIPLMEKRQVKRRLDYQNYQIMTSKLLFLPNKKHEG